MKLIKPILLALIMLNSNTAISAANTIVSGEITYLAQWTTGLLIKINGDNNSNPAGCSRSGSYMLNINADPSADNTNDNYISTNDNYKFMKSILLAAKLNNERVQLSIFGGGCLTDRPKIVSVRLL